MSKRDKMGSVRSTFWENVSAGLYRPRIGLAAAMTAHLQISQLSRANTSVVRPCLKRCDDSSLGDGDALLFHGLVDACSVLVVHLVKLVDKTDTLVSKHKRATLQDPLARDGILGDRGSQTNGRCTLRAFTPRKADTGRSEPGRS